MSKWLCLHLMKGPKQIGNLVQGALVDLCIKSEFAGVLFDVLWDLYFVENGKKHKKTSLCFFKLLNYIILYFQDTFSIVKITKCLKCVIETLQTGSTDMLSLLRLCCSLVKSSSSSSDKNLESLRNELAAATFRMFLMKESELENHHAAYRAQSMLLLKALASSSEFVRQDIVKMLLKSYDDASENNMKLMKNGNNNQRRPFKKRKKEVGKDDTKSIVSVAPRRLWHYSPNDNERASCGYVGLKNFGCTCYFNSLMQQFFMMPVFRDAILTIRPKEEEEEEGDEDMKEEEEEEGEGTIDNSEEKKAKRRRLNLADINKEKKKRQEEDMSLIREFKLMFAYLKLSHQKFYIPDGFCKLMIGQEPLLKTVEQQDVDEFFRILMDRLENELKYTSKPNFLNQFFGGVLINQIIPQGCPRSHRIEREEKFYALQLEVKNKASILHSLEAYVEGDMLDGDNKYLCETCAEKKDTLKRVCLKASALPETLILHLKRFEFDMDTLQRMKVNTRCEFPHDLNMRPYTNDCDVRDQKLPDSHFHYELVGIVVHAGSSESGHYYSFIRERDTSHWIHFNDSNVESFDPRHIEDQCFGGVSGHGSKRYYQRQLEKPYNAYVCEGCDGSAK